MNVRKARVDEVDTIFLMGYDTWNVGETPDDYIISCHASPEYEEGVWYVLEDTTTNELLSSLILYDFNTKYEKIYGVGSVATPPNFRKKGYASTLMKKVMSLVMDELKGDYILLHCDIDPSFYEKLGFIKAPDSMQNGNQPVCMIFPSAPPYL